MNTDEKTFRFFAYARFLNIFLRTQKIHGLFVYFVVPYAQSTWRSPQKVG